MGQKIAVVFIHGAGNKNPVFADGTIALLKDALPEAVFNDLAFMPVHWAPVLSDKEDALWEALSSTTTLDFSKLRLFMLNFFADTIAYQPGRDRRNTYEAIHAALSGALRAVAEEAGGEAPLVVMTHSLGTVISHNYFYDITHKGETGALTGETPLEYGSTLVHYYTMGSPLALWAMRYDDYTPIVFPGTAVAGRFPNAKPGWVNFYDKDDIIAFPLAPISHRHTALAIKGYLRDAQVNIGGWFEHWNPLSHLGYWEDADVLEVVAGDLKALWEAINPA